MKKKLFLVALLFLLRAIAHGQSDSSANENLNYNIGFSSEFFTLGKPGAGIGGIIGKNIGHRSKSNYYIGMYADIILSDTLIAGPRINLTYNHRGLAGLGLNIASYYRDRQSELRITPQLNFSFFGLINLSFGLNMGIRPHSKMSELSQIRAGLTLNLVRPEKKSF